MTLSARDRLVDLLGAVEIDSPSSLRLAGQPVPVRPVQDTPGVRRAASALPEHLEDGVASLQQELYHQAYTFPFHGTRRREPAPEALDPGFVDGLVRANTTRERWETGWVIDAVEPSGRVLARKAGGIRTFQPGEYRPSSPAGVAPGAPIQAFLAKGSVDLQPGFYVVFGESVADADAGFGGSVRVYFNVDAEGAAPLVTAVTRRLNRFQVPFSFKTLSRPSYFVHRTDAAVLFLHRRYFHVAAELAASLPAILGPRLGHDTPLFAKVLAPGIGVAEDPGTGDSFGLSRCRLLSEGVWSAWQHGDTSPEARLRRVEERFREAGLSLDHAHLNPGSIDRYEAHDLIFKDLLSKDLGGP